MGLILDTDTNGTDRTVPGRVTRLERYVYETGVELDKRLTGLEKGVKRLTDALLDHSSDLERESTVNQHQTARIEHLERSYLDRAKTTGKVGAIATAAVTLWEIGQVILRAMQ